VENGKLRTPLSVLRRRNSRKTRTADASGATDCGGLAGESDDSRALDTSSRGREVKVALRN
jgi:hypothetical protein